MTTLQEGQALDDLAQHLYQFLPGKPHPYAAQDLSFPGVAAELGLSVYWQGGSKQPAIRKLLEGVLNSGKGNFSALILKIVERSITYRKRSNPVARDEIERLNELLAQVGYKIPDLHSAGFLDRLPRAGKPEPAPLPTVTPQALAALQDRMLKLAAMKAKAQERGYAFEGFLSELFALYGLASRGSFRLIGEQIDGSFQVGQEVYLLEAKWQDARTAQADLLVFNGKVEGKATGALGLFVSYSGFTPEGLQAFAHGRRTSILCMDGLDLAQVLSGRLSFTDVIGKKRRRALETNSAFVPVRDLFSSAI
jgi:hypothetical protein